MNATCDRLSAITYTRELLQSKCIDEATHEAWRDSIIASDPWDEDGTQQVSLNVANILQLMNVLRKFNGCSSEINCHIVDDDLNVTAVLDDRTNANCAMVVRNVAGDAKKLAVAMTEILELASQSLTGLRVE